MSAVSYMVDRLQNLVANLGTSRDKSAGTFYAPPILTQDQILNAYRGAWLPRKIVDIPAFDSCRKWRNWQADKAQITAIEAEEARLGLREKTLRAMVSARLFGYSALMIGDGSPTPALPLDVERIGRGGLRYVVALSRRQFTAGEIDQDPGSPYFGRPRDYRLNLGTAQEVIVHPSRLSIFIGAELPDDGLSAELGESVLVPVMEAVKHADATSANVASLVFESKVDVIRIPNLMMGMDDPRYEAKVVQRFTLAAMGKGNNGTLILDKEEEYEQKAANFGTLPEIMDRFYQAVSGAADIPMTRLFGQSPAGLNSTGEGDLRNYYDRVQALQELEMTPAMAVLDDALVRSALGSRPAEIFYRWASLWQTTEKERAEIGQIQANIAKTMADSGVFPDEVISEAVSNAMIESGTLPGLEGAIDEFGLEPEEDDDATMKAALLPTQKGAPNADE